jgi:hypothetical protein
VLASEVGTSAIMPRMNPKKSAGAINKRSKNSVLPFSGVSRISRGKHFVSGRSLP